MQIQLRDFLPLLIPVGFWLGFYAGIKHGQLQERRKQLLDQINNIKKMIDNITKGLGSHSHSNLPPPGMVRGPTLMFDHPPTEEEIQAAINKLSRSMNIPPDQHDAVKSEFESTDIFKSIKNLDNNDEN